MGVSPHLLVDMLVGQRVANRGTDTRARNHRRRCHRHCPDDDQSPGTDTGPRATTVSGPTSWWGFGLTYSGIENNGEVEDEPPFNFEPYSVLRMTSSQRRRTRMRLEKKKSKNHFYYQTECLQENCKRYNKPTRPWRRWDSKQIRARALICGKGEFWWGSPSQPRERTL